MRLPSHQESTGRGDADLLHLRHQQWNHPHKSVFREKEEKLALTKAVEIATEVEQAANTAKPRSTQGQMRSRWSIRRSPSETTTTTTRSHHHLPNHHLAPLSGDTVVERTAMRWRAVVCLTLFAIFWQERTHRSSL